jgi:hypothetical protein
VRCESQKTTKDIEQNTTTSTTKGMVQRVFSCFDLAGTAKSSSLLFLKKRRSA